MRLVLWRTAQSKHGGAGRQEAAAEAAPRRNFENPLCDPGLRLVYGGSPLKHTDMLFKPVYSHIYDIDFK